MAWFLLARVLFLAAVTGAAIFLRPLDAPMMFNAGFGLLLGTLVVAFEWRMRDLSATHMLGAVLGAALGLALTRMLVAALFWANTGGAAHRVPACARRAGADVSRHADWRPKG